MQLRYSGGPMPWALIAPRSSAMRCTGTWWCSTAKQMRGDGRSSRLLMPSVPWKQLLMRDPVADRIGSVVVAVLTRTRRGLVSELVLTAEEDRVPTDCVVNFDNMHTLPRSTFRRRVTQLSPGRMTTAVGRFATHSAANGHRQPAADDRFGHNSATGGDRIS